MLPRIMWTVSLTVTLLTMPSRATEFDRDATALKLIDQMSSELSLQSSNGQRNLAVQDVRAGYSLGQDWMLYVPGRGHVALCYQGKQYTHIASDPHLFMGNSLDRGTATHYGDFRKTIETFVLSPSVWMVVRATGGGVEQAHGIADEIWVFTPGKVIHIKDIYLNDGNLIAEESASPLEYFITLPTGFATEAAHALYWQHSSGCFVDPQGNLPAPTGKLTVAVSTPDLFERYKKKGFDPLADWAEQTAQRLKVSDEVAQMMCQTLSAKGSVNHPDAAIAARAKLTLTGIAARTKTMLDTTLVSR